MRRIATHASGRLALLALPLLVGCAELADVERLRCGNGLHEPRADEDCDGLPPGSDLRCGPPGTVAACRFTCLDSPCPDGWLCGGDNICRVGAGLFRAASVHALPGNEIAIGDVDGDGHADVVAQSTASLHVAFGTAGGDVDEVHARALPEPDTAPAVGDVDGDGLDDIVTYGFGGPVVHRGRPDRLLVPVATPAARPEGEPILALGVRATAPYATRQLFALWRTADGVRAELDGAPVAVEGVELLVDLIEGALPPRIAVGDLDGGGDVIALGLAGGERVEVVRVGCERGGCALAPVQSIAGPDGARLSQGTFFGDIDADGDLDLLAQFEDREALLALSTYAPPTGFGPFEVPAGMQVAVERPRGGVPRTPNVQAVVDFVGDDLADVATDQQLFVQSGPLSFEAFDRLSPGRPANRVAVGDLDGDRRPDLVVADDGGLNLVVFGEDDRFVRTLYSLGGIGDFAVGDFDGDGRDEVIAHQTGDGALFYTTDGGLAQIGVLDPAPARLAKSGPEPERGNITPATLHALAEGAHFALEGHISGTPFTREQLRGTGRLAAAGRLVDGRPGLLVANQRIGGDGDLFALPGSGVGAERFGPVDDDCRVGGSPGAITRVVSGPDGDALLELTTGFTGQDDGMAPGGPRPPPPAPDGWHLRRYAVFDGAARCDLSSVAHAALAPIELERLDFDGDGLEDVVALLIERPDRNSEVRRSTVSALAVWLARDGGIPAEATVVDLPDAPLAMTALRLAEARTLLLAGDGGLYAARWADGGVVTRRLDAAPARVQAIAGADIDGDGLDDLVIKTVEAVSIRRQPPCTARDAWEGLCLRAGP